MPAVLQNVWLKIKKYKLPLLGAVLLLTLCLILAGNAHRRDHYQVQAVWQEENATLSVQETIRLTNRAGESLDHLCLRLYPNAFAEERSVPVPDNELSIAYPEGFASGGVSNLSVQVNGKNAPFMLEGAQRTVLRVQLPFSLRPQGGTEVTLRYDAALSRNRLRTGVLTKDVRLCNVLATLCIFQDGAFRTDDYTPIGDPFLSECADWDVELSAPGGYVAAGPGLVRAEDGRWIFRTRNQRDFALLLSKDYEVAQAEQNGICIRSFAFTEEDAQQALDTAAQALRLYSEWFGDYPYPDFTVCAADFYVGGMEYPALAIVDQRLYTAQDGMLEFVVAHETAHQWWYAAVGSDQIASPWQDEALAEYSTLLYYESVYGADSFDSLYQNMVRPAVDNPSLRGVGIAQELSRFESAAVYDALVYRKGAAMLHDLRAHLGNEAFLTALRSYYKSNRFKLAAPEDFLSAFDAGNAALAKRWLNGGIQSES